MSSRRRISGAGSVVLVVGAATWLLAPGIVLWALWDRTSTATLAEPRSTWVRAEAPPASTASDADLVLTWSEPVALVAPQWAGTVQDVLVGVGDEVRDGTEICVIDNVLRVAWRTAVPLFRPVARGDRGADVAALNEFLAAQGLAHDDGDEAGASTARGISDYAARIGATTGATFDPAWLVHLTQGVRLTGVEALVVGAPAPGAGTQILLGASPLTGARLAERQSSGNEGEPSLGGPFRPDDGTRVMLGEVTVPVSADGTVVTTEALTAVAAAAVPGEARIRVELVTEVPEAALGIPYGAVVSDSRGTCVARRTSAGHDVVPIELALPGTGRVYVLGPLASGDEVLVPPRGISCSGADR